MKIKLTILVVAGIFALSLVQFSCSSSNKSAVPCPDFSHSRNMKSRHAQLKNIYPEQPERYHANTANVDHHWFKGHSEDFTGKNATAALNYVPLEGIPGIQARVSGLYSDIQPAGIHQVNLLMPVKRKQICVSVSIESDPLNCDTIVLRNGEILKVKVVEIGEREIRYKKCEETDGPLLSINLSEVFMIKYPNGTRDYFTTEKGPASSGSNAVPRKTHGMANAGFIASLVGLFILGIPLGIMAVVFGFVSLGSINKHPERYKGRGYAIASIIIGAVDIIGMLILLATM